MNSFVDAVTSPEAPLHASAVVVDAFGEALNPSAEALHAFARSLHSAAAVFIAFATPVDAPGTLVIPIVP